MLQTRFLTWDETTSRLGAVFRGSLAAVSSPSDQKQTALLAGWTAAEPWQPEKGSKDLWVRHVDLDAVDDPPNEIGFIKLILRPALTVTLTELSLIVRCCGRGEAGHFPGRPYKIKKTFAPGMRPDPTGYARYVSAFFGVVRDIGWTQYIFAPEDTRHEPAVKEGILLLIERLAAVSTVASHVQRVELIPHYCCVG